MLIDSEQCASQNSLMTNAAVEYSLLFYKSDIPTNIYETPTVLFQLQYAFNWIMSSFKAQYYSQKERGLN